MPFKFETDWQYDTTNYPVTLHHGHLSKAKIIGLVVGLVGGVLACALAVYTIFKYRSYRRKKWHQEQEQI